MATLKGREDKIPTRIRAIILMIMIIPVTVIAMTIIAVMISIIWGYTSHKNNISENK